MISVYKEEHDSVGRNVVEIGMNERLIQAVAVVMPLAFLGFAWFAVGWGPNGPPWFIFAAPIAFGAIAFAMVTWISRRSMVRIAFDGGKLLVSTSAGQTEVRIADVANAEFGVVPGSEGGSAVYRLEFVMKNGERVPATSMYSSAYSLGHQAKTVAAINAALGPRMV